MDIEVEIVEGLDYPVGIKGISSYTQYFLSREDAYKLATMILQALKQENKWFLP